jgi:hypothetical protein
VVAEIEGELGRERAHLRHLGADDLLWIEEGEIADGRARVAGDGEVEQIDRAAVREETVKVTPVSQPRAVASLIEKAAKGSLTAAR